MVARVQGAVARENQEFVELVDLARGRTVLAAIPPESIVLAVDADHGWVAYRHDDFHEADTDLVIAKFQKGKLNPVVGWEPYAHEDWDPRKEVEACWFLTNGRVMTANVFGTSMTVWDVRTATAVFALPVDNKFSAKRMGLSPDRHYTAISMDAGIAIIDLEAGKHVATIATDLGRAEHLAFAADNSKLAAIGHDETLRVWDLKTGELLSQFNHRAMSRHEDIAWVGDFVCQKGRYLYDYNRHILLWEMVGPSAHNSESAVHNGTFCILDDSKSKTGATIRATSLPKPEMVEMANSLGSADDLLAASAGDPVAIELDIDESIIRADAVRSAIEANLREAGYVIADQADLVVTAVCKRLPPKTIKIRMDQGAGFDRTENVVERTIIPSPSSLHLKYQGKVVFARSNMGRPGMAIWANEGESLDAALKRRTTPNTALITETKFPTEIRRPGNATRNGAYGVTTIGNIGQF